jgi:hypothetical protein
MRTIRLIAIAALALFGLMANAKASPYVVTIQQVGSDVVATGSGNINTTGLTGPITGFTNNPQIRSSGAYLDIGFLVQLSSYLGVSGPTNFGTGNSFNANTATGFQITMDGAFGFLFLPTGYVSDTPLFTSTATFTGLTLAGLSLTSGTTYKWTWGTGTGDQNFTIKIGTPVIALAFFAIQLVWLLM